MDQADAVDRVLQVVMLVLSVLLVLLLSKKCYRFVFDSSATDFSVGGRNEF
jgi:hypothetical protein